MAIVQQEMTIDTGTFIVTTSSAGMLIENESGERYEEAWDLPSVHHTYTETDVPIENEEFENEDAEYAAAGRLMFGAGE